MVVRLAAGEGDSSGGITDLEAGEAPHGDVLTEFAALGSNKLRNVDGLFFVEGLLQQPDLLVELLHHASDHLLSDVCRLAAGNGLREVDVLLAGVICRRDVFLPHILRVARGNMHSNVVDQLFEVLGARHKIAFAVDLDQYANLAASVNVVRPRAFTGHSGRLLGSDG